MLRKIVCTALVLTLFAACKKKEDEDDDPTENFTLVGSGEADASLQGRVVADGADPEEMLVKVYGFYISESEDCSDMIAVYENDDPDYEDFLSDPTFGKAAVSDGTYPCVAFRISDVLKFTPAEDLEDDDGNLTCEQGEEMELEVCRDGTTGQHFDEEEFECSEDKEEEVTFYVSTVSESEGGGESYPEECQSEDGGEIEDCSAMLPPSEDYPYKGFKLSKALKVSGATTGKIVIDGSGKVEVSNNGDEGAASCDMQPPKFSFEKG